MRGYFVKSKFVRNVAHLVAGAGLAQLITFMTAPLIARLYGAESLGEQSTLLAIAGPITTLTSMAFPIAIVIAPTDDEAVVLSRLAFLGSIILSPIVTALLLFHDMWILRQLGLADIGTYVIFVPILVVFTTMNMSAGYLMTRYEAFGLSAKAAIAAASVGSLAKITFGAISPTTLSLLVGNALGYIVLPLMASSYYRRIRGPEFRIAEMKRIALGNKDFPLLRAPQNFIAALSQSIPIVALNAGFGAVAAGHYAVAMALAGAPVMLIGNAVQSVLYPRLTAAAHTDGGAVRLLTLSTSGLLCVGVPIFALIMALGASIFQVLLGPEWREAGIYSALLAPWFLMGLANRPAVSLIPVLGLQHGLLIYEVIGTAVKITSVMIGLFVLNSARWTVAIFSISGALAYLLLIVWVFLVNRKFCAGR